MQCSICGAESAPAAKFCSDCGAALALACPQCRHLNPRPSRFCAECGGPLTAPAPPPAGTQPRSASPPASTPPPPAEKILADRSVLVGEHKQVTVLFADVAGFTALTENLDPEESYGLMQRCFDLILAEVHRYEGTVTQFLGDGILALFGAPIAHEDHAQRAVHAALAIQQALTVYQEELQESRGILFRLRIGLNSGPVVVGTIGTDLNMTYTAIGDTVNLGDRVRQLAEPGTVVVSQNTDRLVRGYFDTRALGRHQVKGKEQAVSAYEVLRPRRGRSRVEIAAEQGLTPLVGRQPELQALFERWEAARVGNGQTVLVLGEAGSGKSRLLHELQAAVTSDESRMTSGDGLSSSLLWLEGRCISYGQDIAYLPVVDLLKHYFTVQEIDPEAEIAARVEAAGPALGRGLSDHLPFLKYLLGVDAGEGSVATLDPQMRKVRLFEALRALFIAAAARRPLVITVEDLHWIDPLSEEFLTSFAATAPEQPILLLLTARRGYEPRFTPPPSGARLELQSLSEGESAALAQGLLGVAGLPEELQTLIYRKAEGNPFFIEEVTRSLLEAGAIRRTGAAIVLARRIEEIRIPGTIQDVIMARLDRLPEEPKRAIQTASVIGREFTGRLLERTAELQGRLEEYLQELKAVELIYERSAYPELAYMFKHALTHDVAYHSLLVARRKALHRLVGAAIEELYRDRLEEQYETLAYHYEQAEAWEKAREYLQKSGDKALAAFAPAQAISFYDRALAVVTKSGQPLAPDQALGLHCSRGEAQTVVGQWDGSIASFQAVLKAAQALGDRLQEVSALCRISDAYRYSYRFAVAREYAGHARRLALELNDPNALAWSALAAAWTPHVTGDVWRARQFLDEAQAIIRQAGLSDLLVMALFWSSLLRHHMGEEAQALAAVDEGLRIGPRLQAASMLEWLLLTRGLALCGRGEYEAARRSLQEALALAARLGDQDHRGRILNTLGWLHMDLCHWELALHYNQQSAAEVGGPGGAGGMRKEVIRNAELNLADCHLALDQWEAARQRLEAVREACERDSGGDEEWMKWRYTQHLNASLADLWLAGGEPEKALVFADACLTASEATGSRRNIVKGRRGKGEALGAMGKRDEAEAELEMALRAAREVGNPAQLWKTLAALARLRQAQGRAPKARAVYQEAITVIEGVAAGLSDAGLRETLLASPQVSALRSAAGS